RSGTLHQSLGLFGQGVLQISQQGGVELYVADVALGITLADQVPGRYHDLPLALGDLVFTRAVAAHTTTGYLRLRVASVEGLYLDEEHVGLHTLAAIVRFGVVGDEVTGLQGHL